MKSSPNNINNVQDLFRNLQLPDETGKSMPPVHLWSPEHCGDIGMEIRKDGSWWHQGTRFHRQKLVKLFSTILRKEEDGTICLVTPVEKILVHVEDAPFLAVRVDRVGKPGEDQELVFLTNMDEVVIAGQGNPLVFESDETGNPAPYIEVRNGLRAKLTRAVFYELVNYGVAQTIDGSEILGVWSNGQFFTIGATDSE